MRCTVATCSNSSDKAKKNGLKISFHSFPKDPKIRKAWIIKCKRDGKWNPDSCHVCSDHFTPEDFKRDLQAELLGYRAMKRLRANAVPSLNLPIQIGRPVPPSVAKRRAKHEARALKEVHFAEEQFETHRQDGRKLLKQSAFPTVFSFPQLSKAPAFSRDPPINGVFEEDGRVEESDTQKDKASVLKEIRRLKAKDKRRKQLKTEEDEVIEFLEKSEARKPRRRKEFKTEEDEVMEFIEESEARKPRRRKEFKTEEDEVIEFIEELEARKPLPQCVVCCRPLVNEKKEYLGTLTSTSGLSLHECLIGISGDKPTNIKLCTSKDMVCYYCAHLINYADKLEAELSKLKAAINGCLKINCMGEEVRDTMKPDFDSHIATLDEFGDRVVGPGSAADRQAVLNELPDDGVSSIMIQEVMSIQEPSQVEEKQGKSNYNNSVEEKVQQGKSHKPAVSAPRNVELPVLKCKICHLKTTSHSVLMFHLRRHMANYQWCDFCDLPILEEENKGLNLGKKYNPT